MSVLVTAAPVAESAWGLTTDLPVLAAERVCLKLLLVQMGFLVEAWLLLTAVTYRIIDIWLVLL